MGIIRKEGRRSWRKEIEKEVKNIIVKVTSERKQSKKKLEERGSRRM